MNKLDLDISFWKPGLQSGQLIIGFSIFTPPVPWTKELSVRENAAHYQHPKNGHNFGANSALGYKGVNYNFYKCVFIYFIVNFIAFFL